MRARSLRAGSGLRGRSRPGRAGSRIPGPLHLDLGGDYRDAVFVAGSGRSGTTWLAEILRRSRGGYRTVFEPFHPEKVPLARPFGYRCYLRPGDSRPELLESAGRILSGEPRGPWTDRFNRRLVSRRRLVKEIRANLFLGWLAASFPEMPVVLLLRHPCAVALSRTKLGWRSRLEEFAARPELVEDFLGPVLDGIHAAATEFERHVFAWCIETLVPLRQLGRGRAHLVFYEGLCESPEEELQGLSGYLGRGEAPVPTGALRNPSALSRPGGAVLSGVDPAASWQEELGRDQVQRASGILASFGLDAVYGESPAPDTRAAWELLEDYS